ncbi:enoyl-CoA hydratase/carnithine racemase [Collybia nuda]|uniref:Enoyl-CoA hydratase/carnithine racemase n=1 Tax=Collybia nuda TaxID=64659 RepID=A0A9P6CEJ0_9AGAR|nr:enoyl-CoA hydratase/carnithine racemase [Collybia nuda]
MAQLTPPPTSEELIVSFPADHVLQLTFNRPKSLNAMTPRMSDDLKRVLDWFEDEPQLWVVIVTGAGRVFCAGADLKAWNTTQQKGDTGEQERLASDIHGFGSLSRRQSRKPVVAAVHGGAYGGGMEMLLNCDYVVADEGAEFALPEVKRGVVAVQGGILRLALISGHQLASEMLLLGKTISAVDARTRFGFINEVVPAPDVLPTALTIAKQITSNSPDAVQSTKEGLLLAQQLNHREAFLTHALSPVSRRVYKGGNIKEGLKAFSEKRSPTWKNPAKL